MIRVVLQSLISVGLATTAGCESIRQVPTEYVIAVGRPVAFVDADWSFDSNCAEKEPQKPAEFDCVGSGEVYRARFSELRVLAGYLPRNTNVVGVIGHALVKNQRGAAPMLLILKRSAPDLLGGTGLEYYATTYRYLDSDICFHEKLDITTGLVSPRLRYEGVENGRYCYSVS